jgi:dihydrofolate reductase
MRGPVAKDVAALKAQDGGDLALFGGADIAAAFMGDDLVDEFHLFTHPVVLGGGKPLFGPLEVASSRALVRGDDAPSRASS